MSVRVLDDSQVRALLPMRECIEVMAGVLQAASRGDVVNPLRRGLRFPDGTGLLGMMPAWLQEPHCSGIKVVTVMPGNHGTPYDAHQGVVLLFEPQHGRLVAVLDASAITAIRTAAVSAVATRALAREDVAVVGLLGSGVQAAAHVEAMTAVRPVREIRVWSRNAAHAQRFAERTPVPEGVELRAVPDAAAAVRGAHVVCTTTASPEPVLQGAWLDPGTHVNAVGACIRTFREVDTETVKRARVFVDARESALNEAGDLLFPIEEGAIGADHIAGELGEVLRGKVEGRRDDHEITFFESLGIGAEDVAVAHYLHAKAEREDAGTALEIGGRRA